MPIMANLVDRVLGPAFRRYIETYLGGEHVTKSGKKVSTDTAFESLVVRAAIRVLSEDVATLPLHLYKREADDSRVRATNHSLYGVLHDQPNERMTTVEAREALMVSLLTWGNAYAFVQRDSWGRTTAYWPLRPDKMLVWVENGKLIYGYMPTDPAADAATFQEGEIMHVRAMSSDGVMGRSPVMDSREAIGAFQAAQDYTSEFFGNGMNANSYVYRPAGAPELGEVGEAKLKQSLRDKRGADQSWLMAVLEEGTEIKTYGYSAEQMQLIDARKFNVLEVCRIFRLPPHKLQAFETGASFASVQVANDDYYVSSIRPWLVRLENRMNLCLLTPAERQVYYVEHDVKGILRADIKTRFDAYAVARQWGWMSANGVLRAENEPPIGPAGDVFLSPSNMADASQIPQLTADLAAQAAGRQALGSGQQGG